MAKVKKQFRQVKSTSGKGMYKRAGKTLNPYPASENVKGAKKVL